LARLDCLECIVGRTDLLIPVRDLDRVTEYELTAPPPLAPLWIGGLSLMGDAVCVSLSLSGHPRGPLSSCKGLLLRDPVTGSRYVVQVDEVGGITSVEPGVPSSPLLSWVCPEGWLVTTTKDFADVLRLDTDAVAAALFARPEETRGLA
jgi:hypothetical protein